MVLVGDDVVLVGTVRIIDGDNAVVVTGANGNHVIRCTEADLIEVSTIGTGGGPGNTYFPSGW